MNLAQMNVRELRAALSQELDRLQELEKAVYKQDKVVYRINCEISARMEKRGA